MNDIFHNNKMWLIFNFKELKYTKSKIIISLAKSFFHSVYNNKLYYLRKKTKLTK